MNTKQQVKLKLTLTQCVTRCRYIYANARFIKIPCRTLCFDFNADVLYGDSFFERNTHTHITRINRNIFDGNLFSFHFFFINIIVTMTMQRESEQDPVSETDGNILFFCWNDEERRNNDFEICRLAVSWYVCICIGRLDGTLLPCSRMLCQLNDLEIDDETLKRWQRVCFT